MVRRTTFCTAALFTAALAVLTAAHAAPADGEAKQAASPAPRVEVVFCLDTTGSMKGLLDRAKEKIWSISNAIAGAKPSPEVKIGLVAFRDRGDDYITKVFDLTDDLDEIHARLKEFKAAGGGDIPESVNEALDVAVNKIKWSTDDDTLRILFLVGDAPPHMDYPDDVKYPVTCKKACEKGIVINTIQCGNDADCTKYWQDISRKAEGAYVQISQQGGVRTVVATPFDKDLAAINEKLAGTTLVFGSKAEQSKAKDSADEARKLAPAAAADRAGFNAKRGQNAAYDLLDAIKSGKVELEKLKKEELPEELRGKTLQEQKDYLEKLEKERTELRKKALELDKQRSDYIQKELEKDKEKKQSSFDGQVLEVLRKQGKKAKLDFESK
jgi:Mg-chelatase subunit ChlD